MLILKNLKDKRNSWYICDKCGKKLTGINTYKIKIHTKKKWDLCLSCLKDVKKYIEGSTKNEY